MSGYDITGINGLGTLGLGGTSTYSSYYDPMMMGMGMGMTSPYGMGSAYSPYGMMGIGYNPSFMSSYMREMNKAQQQIEIDQLNHASAMHNLQLQNQTSAFSDTDRALFEKAMVDAGVNKGIINLAAKVQEGDMDGVCQMFDELKQTLYTKYSDYFKANASKLNPADSVTNFIELLYSQIVSQNRGEQVSLRGDIKKYGETAFEHGFWKNFHGKDYHDKYSEETMSYVFGTPIDNKSGKDRMEKYGAATEKVTETVIAGTAGGIVGGSLLAMLPKIKFKWAAPIAAAAAIAGDWLWQQSRA